MVTRTQAKQQQVHGFIRWLLRCCCQFITKLMVTLMTATNDTNRPVLIQTHPRKSPTQGALPSNHLHLLQILRFLQTSQPVFLAPKLPVVCARDNYSTSCRPFYASSASSSLDWASCALTQRFILAHTNANMLNKVPKLSSRWAKSLSDLYSNMAGQCKFGMAGQYCLLCPGSITYHDIKYKFTVKDIITCYGRTI